MKDILLFLGSGASAAFDFPTMGGLVDSFEKSLTEESDKNPSNKEMKDMLNLYESIRNVLKEAYSYADLESVFSVIDDIAENVKYTSLGFTSVYKIHSLNQTIIHQCVAENPTQKETAEKLCDRYRTFIRKRLNIDSSAEDLIFKKYGELFNGIGNEPKRHWSFRQDYPTVQKKSIECVKVDWSVYTTNYDLIVESYWKGIAEINKLTKPDKDELQILDIHKLQEQDEQDKRRKEAQEKQDENQGNKQKKKDEENKVLKLVKLHGSLDLVKLVDGRIAVIDPKKIPTQHGKVSVEGEQMLYPIQQKDMYLYPWFDFFKQFKVDLHNKKRWIVIGYGFNDEFIRSIFLDILESRLEKDQHHVMIVIDPNADEIVEKKLGGNKHGSNSVQSVQAKFGSDNDTIIKEAIKIMKQFDRDSEQL